uniref:Uncharacterized protein n=1 Tax=Oryza brachyantha TaxID=4533 RepID=J3L3P0_ORYBR
MKQGLDHSAMEDSSSDLHECGTDVHPPGGFLSYFQDPSNLQNYQPSIPSNYYPAQRAAPGGGEETVTVRTEKQLFYLLKYLLVVTCASVMCCVGKPQYMLVNHIVNLKRT